MDIFTAVVLAAPFAASAVLAVVAARSLAPRGGGGGRRGPIKYIKDKNGRFAGSVSTAEVPTPAPSVPSHASPAPSTQSGNPHLASVYKTFRSRKREK